MLTKNIISFLKGSIITYDNGMDNRQYVATLQAHLMQFRYMLSEETFFALSKSDLSHIVSVHDEIISYLKDFNDSDVNYKPLYKNFPQEVMDLSSTEFYINAIVHYISNGQWVPSVQETIKDIKFEEIKYDILNHIDDNGFDNIFTSLVSINTSLTSSDMIIVKWFVNNHNNNILPETIPFKETLCVLAGLGLEVPVKSTTDVLRIAVHMSGGDVSLPKVPKSKVKKLQYARYRGFTSTLIENPDIENFKFKKFTRKERKYLLNLLEKTNCDASEMVLKDNRWVRLGEILHPGEFAKRYPKAFNAFDKIRNNKVVSWYSGLNKALSISLKDGLIYISQRPGEFSRRIDWLIRTNPNDVDLIMSFFNNAIKNTSNKVLFEMYTHFENRRKPTTKRSIMIKGARKKTMLPELDALPENVVNTVISKLFVGLKDKFSILPELGNCWIDEELKKIPLPTNMRSLSVTSKPMIRGQRLSFDNPNSKVIRAYVHWDGKDGGTDLDLSATFISDEEVTNLYFRTHIVGNSIHSGDVRHRSGPCAEYIDIDICDAISIGYKYVIIDVKDYNCYGLATVSAKFGLMEREFPEKNNIWLPETVINSHILSSDGISTIVSILDLQTKEYILVDLDSNSRVAPSDVKTYMEMIDEYTKPPKVSVYDLLNMHVESRGRLVTLDSNVDTYFRLEDFIHSYEKTAEYMGI